MLNSKKLVSLPHFDFGNARMNVFVVQFVIETICRIGHTNMSCPRHVISSVYLGRQIVQTLDHNSYICGLLKRKSTIEIDKRISLYNFRCKILRFSPVCVSR